MIVKRQAQDDIGTYSSSSANTSLTFSSLASLYMISNLASLT